MEIKKENDKIIQILRSLAIILVLIHHSIVNVNVDSILTSFDSIIICFHMPIFFLISGYLFELKIENYVKNGKIDFIKKKFKHLMLPYLFWTILLWIGVQIACLINISFMKKIGFGPMNVLNLIKGIFTYEVYYTQHLWFLYVLFTMFVLNILIAKVNKKQVLVISIILGITTSLLKYPNIINRLFIWMPFFVIGRCIVNNEKILNNNIVTKIVTIVLFILLSIVRLMIIDINNILFIKIMNLLIAYLLGLIGSYILYLISSVICMNKIKQLFTKIGDYSYEIYLIHNPYFVATSSIILCNILKLPAIMCIMISVTIGIVVPILISKFIDKNLKSLTCIIGKQMTRRNI